MPESPCETIARAALTLNEAARTYDFGSPEERFRSTVAAWLESWAGIDVSEHGPHSDDWAHALRIARAYLGDESEEAE